MGEGRVRTSVTWAKRWLSFCETNTFQLELVSKTFTLFSMISVYTSGIHLYKFVLRVEPDNYAP